ncbi:MAG: haloacid dehalogenase-like hydrolase [Actinobacteria bacterium]|nr:haloacid dehalogenase-like hydrolase [Actinomycetota bacterium]
MRLVVFDIDGTLTLGQGLGTECFFAAFEEAFGVGRADRRLETYAESTDCGIARQAFERALGRAPAAEELEGFKEAYLSRLAREIARHGRAYQPVPGADVVLPLLAARRGWKVAIATGNWRRAARLKLDCAGLVPPQVAACSEDGPSRGGVLAAAVRSAAEAAGAPAFECVVYVGDQPWDLRAAREVGAGFVGIGSDARRRRLEQDGASVVDSYLDVERFLALLDAAASPLSAGSPART